MVEEIGQFRDEALVAFFEGGDDDFDRLFADLLRDFAGPTFNKTCSIGFRRGIGLAVGDCGGEGVDQFGHLAIHFVLFERLQGLAEGGEEAPGAGSM